MMNTGIGTRQEELDALVRHHLCSMRSDASYEELPSSNGETPEPQWNELRDSIIRVTSQLDSEFDRRAKGMF